MRLKYLFRVWGIYKMVSIAKTLEELEIGRRYSFIYDKTQINVSRLEGTLVSIIEPNVERNTKTQYNFKDMIEQKNDGTNTRFGGITISGGYIPENIHLIFTGEESEAYKYLRTHKLCLPRPGTLAGARH
jgi:hypothetical protein